MAQLSPTMGGDIKFFVPCCAYTTAIQNIEKSEYDFSLRLKKIKFILTVLGFEITLRVLPRNKTRL